MQSFEAMMELTLKLFELAFRLSVWFWGLVFKAVMVLAERINQHLKRLFERRRER